MSSLKLFLLATPSLERDGTPVEMETRKALALLAYLAVTGMGHSREALAGLFWPDYDQARAYANLRRTLWALTKARVGEAVDLRDAEAVSLNPACGLWVDVEEFRKRLAGCRTHGHPEAEACARCLPLLAEATDLYRSDFLAGFTLRDSPAFDEWQFFQAESLRREMAAALERLARVHGERREFEPAIGYARRWLALDPLHEPAQRQLIQLYASSGQRGAARRQYQEAARVLKDELGAEPQAETTALYQRIQAGELGAADSAERPSKVERPRHNLPAQLSSFVGREREQAEVQHLLSAARLVTLTGPGGSGKTRLALQVATSLLDMSAFPDGIWLIELAPLADPTLVPQTVAGVLGIKEQGGQPMQATLTDHLRGQTALLVLDNCEHLIAACAQFAETILHSCPKLHLLATSREGLGLPGEMLFVVSALSSPNTPDLLSANALLHYEAVRLFVERAGAALPGFALTDGNAPVVTRICQQLDGLPLAIELAAARVRVLPVEQIAVRLHDRFRLLTGGSRAALPRHQTLQALLDWSYDLLPPAERVLLQRLAVFVGGWTLPAAEAAAGGDGLEPGDVLDLLTQLVNKSLVAVERQHGQDVRYRLLETIREYALAKLIASGESDAVWRRLAEYYIELAKTLRSSDPGGAIVDRAQHLEPERDNLRAALMWSQSTAGTEELGLRLAGAVMVIWTDRGYLNEARGLLEGALAHAQGQGDPQVRARVFYMLGMAAYMQGEYAVASAHMLSSLSLYRAVNNHQASGWTLARLAEIALEQGDIASSISRLEESLLLLREQGDTEGIGTVLMDQGQVALMQEDAARAKALFEDSLALLQPLEMPLYDAWIRTMLGNAAQLEGDYPRARRLYEESLALYQQNAERHLGIPWIYQGLGETALAQGDATLATKHFIAALTLFRDEGDRGAVSFCLAGLAGAAVLGDAPQRAAWLWGAAAALRQSIGARQAPATRATRERLMAAAREQLGEAEFAAAWAAGGAATWPAAIARALQPEAEA